jgi:hypothetical protein
MRDGHKHPVVFWFQKSTKVGRPVAEGFHLKQKAMAVLWLCPAASVVRPLIATLAPTHIWDNLSQKPGPANFRNFSKTDVITRRDNDAL